MQRIKSQITRVDMKKENNENYELKELVDNHMLAFFSNYNELKKHIPISVTGDSVERTIKVMAKYGFKKPIFIDWNKKIAERTGAIYGDIRDYATYNLIDAGLTQIVKNHPGWTVAEIQLNSVKGQKGLIIDASLSQSHLNYNQSIAEIIKEVKRIYNADIKINEKRQILKTKEERNIYRGKDCYRPHFHEIPITVLYKGRLKDIILFYYKGRGVHMFTLGLISN